jgi:hypothetical protein
MENLFFEVMVSGSSAPGPWNGICAYWDWIFWIGVLVGIVGSAVLLFGKSAQQTRY